MADYKAAYILTGAELNFLMNGSDGAPSVSDADGADVGARAAGAVGAGAAGAGQWSAMAAQERPRLAYPAQRFVETVLRESHFGSAQEAIETLSYKRLIYRSGSKFVVEPVIDLFVRAIRGSDRFWELSPLEGDGGGAPAMILRSPRMFLHFERYPLVPDAWKTTPCRNSNEVAALLRDGALRAMAVVGCASAMKNGADGGANGSVDGRTWTITTDGDGFSWLDDK